MSREATERLLRDHAMARLEPDETIIIWCRAWVSKATRFQRVAPRWRDVAVVTDRRLLLFGVGHFTRRPRRRVLADRLDELHLADVGTHPGRGLRLTRRGRAPMLLELGNDPWSRRLVQELQERAGRPEERAPTTPTTPTTTATAAAAAPVGTEPDAAASDDTTKLLES